MLLISTKKERDLADTDTKTGAADFGHDGAVNDVSVDVVAILGVAELKVEQVLKLGRGAVVELEQAIEDPIRLMVNGKLVAKGEVVVVRDMLAIQVTEIVMIK